eukprot:7079414-Prymnesium_polylepis.1
MARWQLLSPKTRQQLIDATTIHGTRLPVMSWLGAGTCLITLYFVDMPNRQRQRLERLELERAALAGEAGPECADKVVKILPNGARLLADGTILKS